MRYNVVYLLGAGFSAPLGLPVVANFLEKSKDQYFSDLTRFGSFANVYRTIAAMSVAQGYYRTDLTNIEEVLSILEMREQFAPEEVESGFRRYVADVIDHHTPLIGERQFGIHWTSMLFGPAPWSIYGAFVAALLGHTFEYVPDPTGGNVFSYRATVPSARTVDYGVVTLNYDRVLENAAENIERAFPTGLRFSRSQLLADSGAVHLAKLHGSTGPGEEIVPPTWNKTLNHERVVPAWRLAYSLLARAHKIRVIGYSLPGSDSYVRYLLRAAVVASPHHHLKNFDVLCLDPDGSVRERYADFLRFQGHRFVSGDTEDYLQAYVDSQVHWPKYVTGDGLEDAHEAFFSRAR